MRLLIWRFHVPSETIPIDFRLQLLIAVDLEEADGIRVVADISTRHPVLGGSRGRGRGLGGRLRLGKVTQPCQRGGGSSHRC